MFDALVVACGANAATMTKTERGPYNRAVKELRAVDATGPEIAARAAAYAKRYRTPLTPMALTKHWSSLVTVARNDDPW